MVLCKACDYIPDTFYPPGRWRIEQQFPFWPDGSPQPSASWRWWPCMNLNPGDDRTARRTAGITRDYAIEVAALLSRREYNGHHYRFRIRRVWMIPS